MKRTAFVLVEYGPGGAADRHVVDGLGPIDLEPDEVADTNRAMVRSPCRLLPAEWFPASEASK